MNRMHKLYGSTAYCLAGFHGDTGRMEESSVMA
ncbi:MAG: hypothetical protein BWZ01_01525 [Deltaproteobacteria bacterium ADurb.BinA179]|jgi:hypothetical protein|nr:MAG: hypothetical protein BWZ01_01525 [Deltaproteobacteria bacterium ADurb.BinA179]